MFGSKVELTESEKIDYIYRKIRARARMDTITAVFKLCFIWFVVYFYVYMLPKLDMSALIDKYAIPYMSKIVQMTAEKTMNNLGSNIWNIDSNTINNVLNNTNTNTSSTQIQRKRNIPNNSSNKWINITPEMIDAVQKAMQK